MTKEEIEYRNQLQQWIVMSENETERNRILVSKSKFGSSEWYLFSGKQNVYSAFYFEFKKTHDKIFKEDKIYLNWNLINLVVGFCSGMILGILIYY